MPPSLLDAPKGSIQSFDVLFERIESVDLKHRVIGSRLTLVCKSARDLEGFPLPAGSINELKCSVKRKYRLSVRIDEPVDIALLFWGGDFS